MKGLFSLQITDETGHIQEESLFFLQRLGQVVAFLLEGLILTFQFVALLIVAGQISLDLTECLLFFG